MAKDSRYKKIVVPLDGSDFARHVIPDACDIARANNSEIILVHVLRPTTWEMVDPGAQAGRGASMARAEMEAHLRAVKGELEGENLTVRAVLLEGASVVETICAFCEQESADVIIMSTHGRTGLSRLLFGSVARELMECSQIPVMLIQPNKGGR